ncbi:MAG TPA: recombinase family protein [Tepidisphaeraceae bacterium]|jgi:DNA invertase Pin-like site-specific DNA recombinase|nr:recombinase family protein [Tepidisphaeraceae bacterium]
MVIAYSYGRFSTKPQAKGNSEERQDIAPRICEQKGWTLDTGLTFFDKGVSAFKGKNANVGDLARFVSLIEHTNENGKLIPGPIKPGSVLIVECLDRISRQKPMDALDTIKSILKKGVSVHTGFDGQTYSYESLNESNGQIYILLGILQRAHEESKTKSIRATKAWEQKQTNAAGKIMTTATCGLPAWTRYNATTKELEHVPERLEIMREMCRLGLQMGAHSIAKEFHRRGIPSWQKKGRWDVTRITKMLKSRMLIGEYQPRKGRKDFGEPVQNYYPPVLTEAEFYQLQSVLGTRSKVIRGKRGPSVSNLFGALATSGDDGSVMRVSYKTTDIKRYTSVDCLTGANPNFISFPYNAFENAFLKHVSELDMSGTTTADRAEIISLDGQLSALRAKIDQLQAAATDAEGKSFDRILQMLPGLEAKENEIVQKIETAKAKAHRPQITTSDVAAIAAELVNAPTEEKINGREKLKSAIQAVVEKIQLFIRRENNQRNSTAICLAVVTLRDGLCRWIVVRTKGQAVQSVAHNRPFRPVQMDPIKFADLLIQRPDAELNECAVRCFTDAIHAADPIEQAWTAAEAVGITMHA